MKHDVVKSVTTEDLLLARASRLQPANIKAFGNTFITNQVKPDRLVLCSDYFVSMLMWCCPGVVTQCICWKFA